MKNRILKKRSKAAHIKARIRRKISGTAEMPRLSVFRSLSHIYVQAIDDTLGLVIASSSSLEEGAKEIKSKGEKAKYVGQKVVERLKAKNVDKAVFDRNGRPYHGNIKIVAETARENGLKV